MKKIIAQTALSACAMFFVTMACFLVMGYLFAGPSYGLNLTASLYGMAVGLALIQTFWFTEIAFKKLPYPARIAGFGCCALPLLALCAWVGQWFPVDIPSIWILFIFIYLVILAGMTLIYSLYFKKTAGSYDKALARYRSTQGK